MSAPQPRNTKATQQPPSSKAPAPAPVTVPAHDNNLSEELLASPTSPHVAADAQRVMSATQAWKPALDRRQSWDNQEYKRELQMSRIGDVQTGQGFTERK